MMESLGFTAGSPTVRMIFAALISSANAFSGSPFPALQASKTSSRAN
jgi:hypothetical protein